MSDPRILTDYDPYLFGMFDDLDEWLENENCSCEGTCVCQEDNDE